MDIPCGWNDITVRKYLNFVQAIDVLEQIAILTGLEVTDEKVMRLTPKDVRAIKKHLSWTDKLPEKAPEQIKLDGTTYYKKPLNKMNVFEWRSYDYYTRTPDEYYIAHFMAVMYQKEGEEWGYDLNTRAEIFMSANMSYWDIAEWGKFKKLCFEKYPLASDEVVNEEVENENYLQRADRLERERQAKINASLNWEKIMLQLSNDSALEAYKSMRLPILYIFRLITLRKEE